MRDELELLELTKVKKGNLVWSADHEGSLRIFHNYYFLTVSHKNPRGKKHEKVKMYIFGHI